MGKTRGASENSKKAAGHARKAEAANKKRQELDAAVAAEEAALWSQGAKGSSKQEAEAAKKADAARKKAERQALLDEEEQSMPSKPLKNKQRGQEKIAAKRGGKIDNFVSGSGELTLNASGIDNALDALAISSGGANKSDIERHPERRYKAAHVAYEEQRLPEIRKEQPGLRLQQYKELIHKEFEKSDQNPFNQIKVNYNANKEEVRHVRDQAKRDVEKRLAH